MTSEWWDTSTRISSGVPFAVDANGRWRDVSSVSRGKACGCFCAECRSPLIARMGEVRVHHFAHEGKRECRAALETSIFGMAIALLSEPGVAVGPPPSASIHEIARAAGTSPVVADRALKELRVDLSARSAPILLRSPRVVSRELRSSTASQPDLVDEASDLAIHFLSSSKQFYAVQQAPRAAHGRILVINPLVFARGWQLVCDPDSTSLTISSSTDSFRAWLGSSSEGRGWLFCRDQQELVQQVRDWVARQPPPPPPPKPIERFATERRTFTPSLTFASKPPKPPAPNEPNRTLRMDAGVCPRCGGPQDVILFGSGYFAGVRMLTCRIDPHHPQTHLGRAEKA
jgi:hypothetical protein